MNSKFDYPEKWGYQLKKKTLKKIQEIEEEKKSLSGNHESEMSKCSEMMPSSSTAMQKKEDYIKKKKAKILEQLSKIIDYIQTKPDHTDSLKLYILKNIIGDLNIIYLNEISRVRDAEIKLKLNTTKKEFNVLKSNINYSERDHVNNFGDDISQRNLETIFNKMFWHYRLSTYYEYLIIFNVICCEGFAMELSDKNLSLKEYYEYLFIFNAICCEGLAKKFLASLKEFYEYLFIFRAIYCNGLAKKLSDNSLSRMKWKNSKEVIHEDFEKCRLKT